MKLPCPRLGRRSGSARSEGFAPARRPNPNIVQNQVTGRALPVILRPASVALRLEPA